jgi:Golgi SNAP receptor complex protein 1
MGSTLEELRKEARKLETLLDNKLVSYSKFGANFAHSTLLREDSGGGGSTSTTGPAGGQDTSMLANSEHVSNSMALEIEQMLIKLSEINEEMSRCNTSAAFSHILQNHRSKLHEFTQEFRRTKNNINATREHAELLISVREDISQYKKGSGLNSRTENLLRERSSLHSIDRVADALLGQAQEAREVLHNQKSMLQGTISKLTSLTTSFPGINTLMGTIKKKKARDLIILGGFISFCICFILFYWLR